MIGHECSITAAPTADDHVVSVVVDPPAVPVPLHLDVTVSETDGVIGVTRIDGATSFKVSATAATPSLRLLDGVPSSAERVQVRFKKGDDVWELSADPKLGTDIPLTVPSGETDNFSNEPIDWELSLAPMNASLAQVDKSSERHAVATRDLKDFPRFGDLDVINPWS